jgi:dephospho-CoA kinase
VSESTTFPGTALTVVLTGGIASGKTAVSDHFARLGAAVIDTDQIARDIVEPGQPALQEIASKMGAGFLDSSGRLDRRRTREAIFADAGLRATLEGILHPRIAREARRRVAERSESVCILVIPLYAESGRYDWVDRVLVVDVDEAVQIDRVTARDSISGQQARAILAAQPSREQRLRWADDVIDNRGSLAELQHRVELLYQRYLELAAAKGGESGEN